VTIKLSGTRIGSIADFLFRKVEDLLAEHRSEPMKQAVGQIIVNVRRQEEHARRSAGIPVGGGTHVPDPNAGLSML
jgi:hypothetical protein